MNSVCTPWKVPYQIISTIRPKLTKTKNERISTSHYHNQMTQNMSPKGYPAVLDLQKISGPKSPEVKQTPQKSKKAVAVVAAAVAVAVAAVERH